jgi:hypothetical protein
MSKAFNEETHQQFTLWFSFDLKVQPQAAQSIIELEAHTLVSHLDFYNTNFTWSL